MRGIFHKDYKVVLGQSKPETALANNTDYPASGSYVDVSGYEWVNVVIHLGTLANTPAFTMKQTDATNGATLDTISTSLCVKTVAATDDGQVINFYIQTANLATDHHFLTCRVTGAGATADYADILYFLGGARHQPVTQTSTVMPSDNTFTFAG